MNEEKKNKIEKKENSRKEIFEWWKSAVIGSNTYLSIIVGPVILGAIIGIWLDKKYGTEPLLLSISVGFFFIISMIGLIKKVK